MEQLSSQHKFKKNGFKGFLPLFKFVDVPCIRLYSPLPSQFPALTDVVGDLLQLLDLDVPGTRWNLDQFESSYHRGGSGKTVSILAGGPTAQTPRHPTPPARAQDPVSSSVPQEGVLAPRVPRGSNEMLWLKMP